MFIQCLPYRSIWEPAEGGFCTYRGRLDFLFVFNAIIDIAILLLSLSLPFLLTAGNTRCQMILNGTSFLIGFMYASSLRSLVLEKLNGMQIRQPRSHPISLVECKLNPTSR
jgi:hypothetical protein